MKRQDRCVLCGSEMLVRKWGGMTLLCCSNPKCSCHNPDFLRPTKQEAFEAMRQALRNIATKIEYARTAHGVTEKNVLEAGMLALDALEVANKVLR